MTKSSYFHGKPRPEQFGSRDQVECKSIARLFARAQRPQCTRKGGRQYTYVGALIVSPTSSKIPLLLRFSLPIFHRFAMHLTISTRLAFYYVLRKIKRGFPFILSSSLLSLVLYSRVLYVYLSHYFFILQRQVDVTAVFVKVDRDGERRERKDSLLRLSPNLQVTQRYVIKGSLVRAIMLTCLPHVIRVS